MISGFLIRKFICFFLVCLGYAPPPFDASSRIFGFGLIIRDIHTLTYYIAFRRDMALGWMCGLKPDGFISSVLGLYICVFLWDCSVSFLFCGIPYNVWFKMLTILLAIIFFAQFVCLYVHPSVRFFHMDLLHPKGFFIQLMMGYGWSYNYTDCQCKLNGNAKFYCYFGGIDVFLSLSVLSGCVIRIFIGV